MDVKSKSINTILGCRPEEEKNEGASEERERDLCLAVASRCFAPVCGRPRRRQAEAEEGEGEEEEEEAISKPLVNEYWLAAFPAVFRTSFLSLSVLVLLFHCRAAPHRTVILACSPVFSLLMNESLVKMRACDLTVSRKGASGPCPGQI